jgi:hypothetical protein
MAKTKPKPALAVGATLDNAGRLWLVRENAGQLHVSRSDDGGKTFSTPLPVLAQPEAVVTDSESRPMIRVLNEQTVVLVWTLDRPEKRFAGDIRFARSDDGGKTWARPLTLNDDGRVTSHRFPSIATDGYSRIAVSWLDGRDRDAIGKDNYRGLGLYTAESPNTGIHWGENRKLAEHTCECCRTALTWSRNLPVAFWRHQFDTNTRDFALAYFDKDRDVVRATDDNWKIDACPHHGGAIAVDGEVRAHMTWFTNGEKRQGLFYANRLKGAMSTPIALGNPDAQPGHADVAAYGNTVLVTWREFDGARYSVYAMRSADYGATFGKPAKLADTAGVADYPLALVGKRGAQVVWRTADEDLRVLAVNPDGANPGSASPDGAAKTAALSTAAPAQGTLQ